MKAMIVYGIGIVIAVISIQYFISCDSVDIVADRNAEIERVNSELFN